MKHSIPILVMASLSCVALALISGPTYAQQKPSRDVICSYLDTRADWEGMLTEKRFKFTRHSGLGHYWNTFERFPEVDFVAAIQRSGSEDKITFGLSEKERTLFFRPLEKNIHRLAKMNVAVATLTPEQPEATVNLTLYAGNYWQAHILMTCRMLSQHESDGLPLAEGLTQTRFPKEPPPSDPTVPSP